MFCHNCGEKNEDGARFCNDCGTALVVMAAESAGSAPQVQPVAPEVAPVPVSSPPTGVEKTAGAIALTPISVCAALLIFSFFMPWVTIEGLSASGYKITELARLLGASSEVQLVWAVPLLGAAALVAGLYRKLQWLALPAGALSIGAFIYLGVKLTEVEMEFNNVGSGFGAWLMLAMGVALVVLGIRELLAPVTWRQLWAIMRSERGQKVLRVTTGCLALVAISDFILVSLIYRELGFHMRVPSLLALFAILTGALFLIGPGKRADGLLLIVAGVFTSIIGGIRLFFGFFYFGPLVLSITCALVFLRQRRQAAGPS